MTHQRLTRKRSGFTMIELVIAIAITAILAAGVYAATQSMTQVARRQAAACERQDRLDRFFEIVRRDIRGWIPAPPSSKPQQLGQEPAFGELTLVLTTTADSLGASANRAVEVQYVVHKVLKHYEIERSETGGTSQASTLVLLRCD